MNINDILALLSFLVRAAFYISALVVIVRCRRQRKTVLALASSYLVAGAIALWLLSALTGAHYDYWDVGFWVNGRLEFPNMDLNFVLIHLGFAVCLGWLIAKWVVEPDHSWRLLFAPMLIAVVAELLFRIHRYKGMLFSFFTDDRFLPKEILASFGPPLFAGIGIAATALIIKNRKRAIPEARC